MYLDYFGLTRLPFSIAPDPELLYLSPAHHEALAHLNYSLTGHGGLICLTGEVGMGKTTLCRAFIEQAPSQVDIAYIFNPMLSATELLQAICQELEINCLDSNGATFQSNKQLFDALYQGLIRRYASGRKVICIIDEAQSMPAPLLEQVRLLTNLETNKDKLLTLILVGQPELQQTLAQHSIRQLDQRITARFHLKGMVKQELKPYLEHRLKQASCENSLFENDAISHIWQASGGVPRLVNSIADRALLGAYATNSQKITKKIAKQAVLEVLGANRQTESNGGLKLDIRWPGLIFSSLALAALMLVLLAYSGIERLNLNSLTSLWGKTHFELLAEANGLDPEHNPLGSCQEIEDHTDFSCLSLNWSLVDLKNMQRPVAVFDGEGWKVMPSQRLSIHPVRSFILWQAIDGFKAVDKPIKPGDSHQLINWVRQRLRENTSIEAEAEWQVIAPSGQQSLGFQSFYDPILAGKVADFQTRSGLKPDRIIGLKTLLALQSLPYGGA